ncbi:IPT/TIG domain-containing protein, partial [Patescibacteria group bacterium]|nr:IPT/TIG domain-containing protein [Patescibacteria group bacterium]
LTAYVPVITHTITSLNPNNGAAAGSYPVTINGTNLDSLTTKTITWGSTSIPSTDSRVTSWGASSIALSSIPLGTANSTVAVTVSGATGSLTFTYNPVTSTTPNITNINPNQGTENGGTPVVLTGTNFGTTEGTVTLQTTPPVTVNASDVTWTSATSITFTTPAYAVSGNTGVSVSITTNGGLTSNSVTYTYLDENGSGTPTVNDPNIAYLTPSSGYADQDVLVTIVGTNFEPTGTTNGTVRFGNYTATIISWTDTAIQVYAPKLGAIASDITHGVTVTRSDGKSDIEYYTYLAPVSTGGTSTNTTTTPSGMPATVWFGLFSLNGGLAFLAKRKLTKHS